MGSRLQRSAAAGAAAFVLAAGTAVGTAATASAAPAPLVAGSCDTTIQGKPGQPLVLDPSGLFGQSAGSLPTITLGKVPEGTRTFSLPVQQIVDTVGGALSNIPIIGSLVDTLREAIGSACDITVKGVNTVSEPVQEATGPALKGAGDAMADAYDAVSPPPPESGGPGANPGGGSGGDNPPQSGGGGGNQPDQRGPRMPAPDSKVMGGLQPSAFEGYSYGRSPRLDYSSLPFANPGTFAPSPGVRYGGQVPGYAPEFGILGEQDGKQGQNKGGQDNVRRAGQAEALDQPRTQDVALPVLLGVFALTGVLAALVRTWVLRRTA